MKRLADHGDSLARGLVDTHQHRDDVEVAAMLDQDGGAGVAEGRVVLAQNQAVAMSEAGQLARPAQCAA
jgi:hypothetical protein